MPDTQYSIMMAYVAGWVG